MKNPYLTGKAGSNQIESFMRDKGAELMGDNPIGQAYSAMSNRFNPIQNQNPLFDTDSWRNLLDMYKNRGGL